MHSAGSKLAPPPGSEGHDFELLLRLATNHGLGARLAEAPLSSSALSALALPARPGEPYGRRVLHESALGEVLLVRWRGEALCAPHDHGAARAYVCLVSGRFVEHRYTFDGTQLSRSGLHVARSPQIVEVPPFTIHAMQASEDAIGLHFYLPGVCGMRLYDRQARRTLTVQGDCGAWLPSDASLVLAEERWP